MDQPWGAEFWFGVAGGILLSSVALVVLYRRAAASVALLASRDEQLSQLNAAHGQLMEDKEELLREKIALVAESAKLAERVAQGEARVAELRAIEQRFVEQFKALSADALKSNNSAFLQVAQASFQQLQERATDQLAARERQVLASLEPIKERVEQFQGHLAALESARVGAYEGLVQQVRQLADTSSHLRAETGQLMRALKNPQARGRWGELQLRRVVELAGMLEHCDFVEQVSVEGDAGKLRPDLVIRMPGGKQIIVDAKAPLNAYLEANDSIDEQLRSALLKQHAQAIRSHAVALGRKGYWEQFESSPEFVILFMPGEAFFSAAIQQDPELIEQCVSDGVLIATPTVLIALLKAVSFGWQQERMAENTAAVQRIGTELYERLDLLAEHFGKMGERLSKAVESFNSAAYTFEHRFAVSARRFKELGAIAVGGAAEIEPVESITVAPKLSAGAKLVDLSENKNV